MHFSALFDYENRAYAHIDLIFGSTDFWSSLRKPDGPDEIQMVGKFRSSLVYIHLQLHNI